MLSNKKYGRYKGWFSTSRLFHSLLQQQLQIIQRELSLVLHDDDLVTTDEDSDLGKFVEYLL